MRGLKFVVVLALSLALAPDAAYADPVRDFMVADADRDGILEAAEFKHFVDLRADGGNAIAKQVRTFRAYSMALSRVDYDGDGKVSGHELKRYDKNP